MFVLFCFRGRVSLHRPCCGFKNHLLHDATCLIVCVSVCMSVCVVIVGVDASACMCVHMKVRDPGWCLNYSSFLNFYYRYVSVLLPGKGSL